MINRHLKFPIHKLEEVKLNPNNFRLLEKIPFLRENTKFPIKINECDDKNILPIIFLDTETTGLFEEQDSIIELGIVRAEYSKPDRKIAFIQDPFSKLEDPGRLIPEHIVQLTGISNDMVQHQKN